MDTVVVRGPATIANLGPGFDALGLALSWHNEVRVERTSSGLAVSAAGPGADVLSRDETNLVVRALRPMIGESGLSVNQLISIPNGRGFGSSAAAVVAGLVAGRALAGTNDTDEQLLEKAIEFEGHADNVAPCLLGGLTVSTAGATLRLEVPSSIHVLVCVAPNAMKTDTARAALPKDIARGDAVANVGRAALLVAALTQGRRDMLMEATKDELHQRARFELMPESGEIVLGLRGAEVPAFLSGAGPSVAALVDETSASYAEKAARTLAPKEWEVRLESIDPQGARIVSRREK